MRTTSQKWRCNICLPNANSVSSSTLTYVHIREVHAIQSQSAPCMMPAQVAKSHFPPSFFQLLTITLTTNSSPVFDKKKKKKNYYYLLEKSAVNATHMARIQSRPIEIKYFNFSVGPSREEKKRCLDIENNGTTVLVPRFSTQLSLHSSPTVVSRIWMRESPMPPTYPPTAHRPALAGCTTFKFKSNSMPRPTTSNSRLYLFSFPPYPYIYVIYSIKIYNILIQLPTFKNIDKM